MVKSRHVARQLRGKRVRFRISESRGQRIRLSVYRSSSNISAQIIDDEKGYTLVSASSLESSIRNQVKNGGNCEAAAFVGKLIAEKAAKAAIGKVVFDRGGYLYHGRIKTLAEAAREAGLDF